MRLIPSFVEEHCFLIINLIALSFLIANSIPFFYGLIKDHTVCSTFYGIDDYNFVSLFDRIYRFIPSAINTSHL